MSDTSFGSGLDFGGGTAGNASADVTPVPGAVDPTSVGGAPLQGAPQAPAPQPAARSVFGSGLNKITDNPNYSVDPNAAPLDQAASLLQQRIKRAGEVVSDPVKQFFNPEGVAKVRDMVPQLTEQLQKIQQQKQQQADVRATATNWGLTNPTQFGPAATDTTLANEALRQWKDEGNFNAYKALSGLSAEWKNRADLYMPDAMAKFGAHVEGVQKGITALNAAANVKSEAAYKAAREEVIKSNDLATIGVRPENIPETRDEWMKVRGALQTQYSQAQRTVANFHARQDQLNQATPVTDEKVGQRIEGTYQFSNGEAIPGFKAVQLPGYGDVQGVMGPPGSRDTANRGVTWSNASPDQVKTVREQLNAEEVKGAISKYKMSRDFYNTASNDKLYKSAAGLALISDELGAIGRDVAEGSKAAGSIGLTKMLEAKYGTVDNARNKLATEYAALKEWMGKGGPQSRLAPPAIQGIKDVAAFKHSEALKEVNDRIAQPLETAGRYGMQLKNLGLDKEITENDALKGTYDKALKAGNREIDSYPMITIGDRRVMLPTGSNVPGAKVAPLDHGPDPVQPQTPGQSAPTAAPASGAGGPPPTAPVQPAAPQGQSGTTAPVGGGLSITSSANAAPPLGASQPSGGGGPSVTTPAGGAAPVQPPTGDNPGRFGLPPGMALNSDGALEAAANRTMQIESGTKPGQTTGSYKGLAQWSDAEMKRHGITDPDDIKQNRAALKTDIQQRATKLQQAGLPATPANVYLMHQQGEAGALAHLQNPTGKAWENVRQFYPSEAVAKRAVWGNMTPEMRRQFPGGVDSVTSGDFTRLWDARYNGTDNGKADIASAAGRRTGLSGLNRTAPRSEEPTQPGIFTRIRQAAGDFTRAEASPGTTAFPGSDQGLAAAVEHAPAVGSTIGAIGGSVAGPVGTVAGGAAGGGVGQSIKDKLQGREQQPGEIAKQSLLGGALSVASEARPVLAAGARVFGAGAVEGGDAALHGADAVDAGVEGLKGGALAAGGEALGRFVGFLGREAHQFVSRYTQPEQKSLFEHGSKLAEARTVMESSEPKLPGGGDNPKYAAAEKQADAAEREIKRQGHDPDDIAYAAEQANLKSTRGEAAMERPLQSEKDTVRSGYNAQRQELADTPLNKMTTGVKGFEIKDGPTSVIRTAENPTGKVDAAYAADAQHAQMLATAPANNPAERWANVEKAQSELLKKERDAYAAGDATKATAMRDMATSLRGEQKRIASALLPKDRAQPFLDELDALDKRYASVMKLSDGVKQGKLQTLLSKNTPEAREFEKNFKALAGDDVSAVRTFNAIKAQARSSLKEEAKLMLPVIAGEATANLSGFPTAGAATVAIGGYRMYKMLGDFLRARALGKTVKFADFMRDETKRQMPSGTNAFGKAAVMGGEQPQLQ